MILTKEVTLRVNSKHRQYYKDCGYDTTKKEITVKIEDLKKGSFCKVHVACDVCGKKGYIIYHGYVRNIKHGGFYACHKCAHIKVKNTKKERYGDENYTNVEKGKATLLDKYGDENYRNPEKNKQTCLERYGKEHILQVEKFKNKAKKTTLDRYGQEYYNNIEKTKKTNLKKYGTKCVLNSKSIIKKIETTNLERYGSKNYFCTDAFKISQGIILDEHLDNWKLYQRKAKRLVRKIKKYILEDWDGIDYYDNEYIKENLKLSHFHGDYPTIDHKISIYYGFMNNISIDDISKVENLVVTKRRNNASKGKGITSPFEN